MSSVTFDYSYESNEDQREAVISWPSQKSLEPLSRALLRIVADWNHYTQEDVLVKARTCLSVVKKKGLREDLDTYRLAYI